MEISFRRMTRDDLPLLREWLQDPEVDAWFHTEDPSPAGIAAKYGPRIDGDDPTEQWLGLVDDVPVAWLQAYDLAHDDAYLAACTGVGADPAGGAIDYLVSARHRDRGLGPELIEAFVVQVALGLHAWPEVCSSPDPANVRSWRALEKAGFHVLGDIVTEDGPERLFARRAEG